MKALFPALCLLAIPSAVVAEWERLPSLPEARGVAAPFAGVSGNALIVAGGANFPDKMPWEGGRKVWHDKVWVLDKPDGTWREAGKLPRPLAYGVSLTVNDVLLCIGGSDAERHYADAFVLGWRPGSLERKTAVPQPAALPIPLANAAGAGCTGGNVYVAGGSTEPGEKAASNRVFNICMTAPKPTWKELAPLPAEPRILPIAAAREDTFYLFGGAALEAKDGKVVRRYLRDAWSFHPARGWRRLADMPKPVAAAASPAPVSGWHIHIVGGDDGSLADFTPPEKHPGFPPAILTYNIAANAWSPGGESPAPRATVPCAEWHGQFIFPSGEVRPGVRSSEVWGLRKDGETERKRDEENPATKTK